MREFVNCIDQVALIDPAMAVFAVYARTDDG